MTHHKSNEAVGGETEAGRGRGMPRRPDQEALERRTAVDREEAGLPTRTPEDPDAVYRAVREQVDREVNTGSMPTGTAPRRDRGFPPTRY